MAVSEIESSAALVVINLVLAGVLDPQALNSIAAHWLPAATAEHRAFESILIFPAPTLNSVTAAAPVDTTPIALWPVTTEPLVVCPRTSKFPPAVAIFITEALLAVKPTETPLSGNVPGVVAPR